MHRADLAPRGVGRTIRGIDGRLGEHAEVAHVHWRLLLDADLERLVPAGAGPAAARTAASAEARNGANARDARAAQCRGQPRARRARRMLATGRRRALRQARRGRTQHRVRERIRRREAGGRLAELVTIRVADVGGGAGRAGSAGVRRALHVVVRGALEEALVVGLGQGDRHALPAFAPHAVHAGLNAPVADDIVGALADFVPTLALSVLATGAADGPVLAACTTVEIAGVVVSVGAPRQDDPSAHPDG